MTATTVTVTLPNGNVVSRTTTRTVTHVLLVDSPDGEKIFSWHGSLDAANKGKSEARRCTYTPTRAIAVN